MLGPRWLACDMCSGMIRYCYLGWDAGYDSEAGEWVKLDVTLKGEEVMGPE